MYSLTIENKYGEKLELTNNSEYVITEILGIDPPDGVINSTKGAGTDGSIFNSATLDNRTITITMYINDPAELNRINLYKYLKTTQPVRIYYENDSRKVFIDGYVQKMPIYYFNKKEYLQIVIFCTNPLFNGQEQSIVDFSYVDPLFEFEFDIDSEGIPFSEIRTNEEQYVTNTGDTETGAIFELHAVGTVVNPSIYSGDANQHFTLNYTLSDGDTVTIDTRKKHKSIKLNHNGTITNLIGYMTYDSTWFVLKPGDNVFAIGASSGDTNLQCIITILDQYQGV